MRKIGITILLGLFAVGVFYFAYTKYNEVPKPITIIGNALSGELSGFVEGSKDVDFKVYNLFDYSCRYCKEAEVVLSKLQEEFAQQVNIIHVPMPLGKRASPTYKAAAYSLCYYKSANDMLLHKYLIENQDSLQSFLGAGFAQNPFNKRAPIEKIKECVNSNYSEDILFSNKKIAREIGISSVPATIIKGKVFVGLLKEKDYRNLIKNELLE